MNNNNVTMVSYYNRITATTPVEDIPLINFYRQIKNGTYQSLVEKVRSANGAIARELKQSLPAVTVSGTFSKRCNYGLIVHSGRICIDIDSKMNPEIEDWPLLRDTLGSWNEVEFSAVSVSGKGVFLVIIISNPDNHLEHFFALEKAFKKYGLVIDASCKDISRLRYMTYDRDAIYNEHVIPFRQTIKLKNTRRRFRKSFENKNNDLENKISEIVQQGIDITESYKNWYELGAGLANEFGEKGRDHFHKLSQFHSGYTPTECDTQYDKCLKNPMGYRKGTIFFLMNKYLH